MPAQQHCDKSSSSFSTPMLSSNTGATCADPTSFPDSLWRQVHGDYCNREPGKPLFVSLLLYLNDPWPRDWDAETLFLDDQTDVGLVVRPRRQAPVAVCFLGCFASGAAASQCCLTGSQQWLAVRMAP